MDAAAPEATPTATDAPIETQHPRSERRRRARAANGAAEPEAPKAPDAPDPLPKIATAADWRGVSRRRWLLPLPSGATVRVKRADVTGMMLMGTIDPADLQQFSQPTTDREELAKRLEVARAMALHVVVEPVLLPADQIKPGEDAMAVEEIPAEDALVLALWATSPAALRAIAITEESQS